MDSDERTARTWRFGGGAIHFQLNKKVMSALLVLFMLEKYKNVNKKG
jgi:hypothetical protein